MRAGKFRVTGQPDFRAVDSTLSSIAPAGHRPRVRIHRMLADSAAGVLA